MISETSGRRVAFQTLGCRLNQFETDALAGEFEGAGYTIVPFDQTADAYIVNSCTVTNKADRKSRNTIYRAERSSDALVVVTGCFVESHRRELERRPRTFTVANPHKRHVVDLVEAHLNGEILHPESLERDLFSYSVPDPIFHTRSMVKIQDGCDNYCTFCIIPFVRGRATSRTPEDVLAHVTGSLQKGYKEIVVTGVNISRYQHGQVGFTRLMQRLLELDGDYRLRISSMEPDSLDDRFFSLLEHPRMCPHLHLCLQSGSERILLKMRRQYTAAQFARMAERIRARRPDFNLTTDVIVGFPGETDDDFRETCALCADLAFGHIHTFAYSRRSGTRADRMNEQVPEAVKQQRSQEIRHIAEEGKRRYRLARIGQTQQLLVERIDPTLGVARGYGEHYVPIAIPAEGISRNSFVPVVLETLDTLEERAEPVLRGRPA